MPFDGTKTSIPDIIDEAALIIEEKGHHQWGFRGSDDSVCMVNALSIAATGADFQGIDPIHYVVLRHLGVPEVAGCTAICHYNNTHTKKECVALLRDIAQKERAHAV